MSHEEPLRCVFLMNDDFTPMDFVVSVLVQFFDMDFETAKNTMLRIHNEGAGECGFYLREEAERKVAEVLAFAERHEHPLQCACETDQPMRANMIDKQVIAILRAGPETSRGPRAPETRIPFVLEVQTANGPASLQFGPQAAAELAEELASYMRLHSKPAT